MVCSLALHPLSLLHTKRVYVYACFLLQMSDLLHAAALVQIGAAEAAETATRAQLEEQVNAFHQAQSDKAALGQRLAELQVSS